MKVFVLLCTCALSVVHAATDGMESNWIQYGPGACDWMLALTITAGADGTDTDDSVAVVFESGGVSFRANSDIQVGVQGTAYATATTSLAAAAALESVATGKGTVTASYAVFSSDTLTISSGLKLKNDNFYVFTIAGMCLHKRVGDTSTDVKVIATGGSDGSGTSVNTLTSTAGGVFTEFAVSSTTAVTVGVEGSLVVTFKPSADFAANDYGTISIQGYTFSSSSACTLLSASSALTTYGGGYDWIGFKMTLVSSGTSSGMTCTKATPRAVQGAVTLGACIADRGTAGVNAKPDFYLCADQPAITATATPTASPSTAACAGGGSAAAAAALWSPAAANSPVAVVIMSIAAVCGALLA